MLQYVDTRPTSVGQSFSPIKSDSSLVTSQGSVRLDITEELHDAHSELPTFQTSQPSSATVDVHLYQNLRQTLTTLDCKWVSATFFRINANNSIELKTV